MRAMRQRRMAGATLAGLVFGLAIACAGSDDGRSEGAAPSSGVRCDDAGSAGGVEIVLAPVTAADDGQLAKAADAVCRRAAALTDAAEVTVVDGTVVARLAGVTDAEHAGALLAGGTLRFRPVQAIYLASAGPAPTAPDGDVPEQPVVLPADDDQVYALGPSAMGDEAVESASVVRGASQPVEDPEDASQAPRMWAVKLVLRPGNDGIDTFNAVASLCYARTPTCPTGQLAVTVDSRVVSAPTIQEPSYDRDQIQVSGAFDEAEANELATMLGAGRLPIDLQVQSADAYE
jgi:preprotein translocase subunit SecD